MYSVYLTDYNSDLTSSIPIPSKEKLYIYDPLTTDEGLMVSEPTLTLTASNAGSFTCTLNEGNYGYGRIIKHYTRVVVEKDDKVIFMGRVETENRDLYLSQALTAEGALSYLNDSVTDKKVFTASTDETNTTSSLYDILSYIFTYHNSKFTNEPWKQFNLSRDNCHAKFIGRNSASVESEQITYYNINFYVTMDAVNELLELANAVLKIEYNDTYGNWDVYIYDKEDCPTINQAIEFGINLLDLVQSYNDTSLCSYVIPFGGELDQVSKEIGEVIGGFEKNTRLDNGQEVPGNPAPTHGDDPDSRPVIAEWYIDTISVRNPNDYPHDWVYGRYNAHDVGSGYWVFGLYINNYNAAHPNTPLKKLYVSWRGYKFTTNAGEDAPEGCIEDCAWRLYDASGNTIGYHAFGDTGFSNEINELIDLTEGQYYGATHLVVSGWGWAIKPQLRRDAIVLDANDNLSIVDCDTSGSGETEDLVHETNSFYLYSKSLLNSFGRVEKKLEYDIEDTAPAVSSDIWYLPYSANGHEDFDFDTTGDGILGAAKEFPSTTLGYFVGSHGDEPNLELNKGHYDIVPFGDNSYKTIQYRLPSEGSTYRPRGVYITCRMHHFGVYDDGTSQYMVNGLYTVFDESWQVLSYKSCEEPQMGEGFTTLVNEFIDLRAPENYGAKYIRVANWGGAVTFKCVPSDEAYARNRLLEQAKLYLTSQQWEKVTIDATAIDLTLTTDEWDSLDICRRAEILSEAHGVEGIWRPITQLEIQLDDPANNFVKLGYDSDEYLSRQLSDNLRLTSVEKSIEERRKNNEYTS